MSQSRKIIATTKKVRLVRKTTPIHRSNITEKYIGNICLPLKIWSNRFFITFLIRMAVQPDARINPPARAAFNIIREDNDESHAIAGSG